MALTLRSVPPARGAQWVLDAWRLFRRKPLALSALFAFFLLAVLFVSLVPLVGGVLQLMALPLLSLGFMIASQSALLEGPVGPAQFVEPLRTPGPRRRDLLLLCAVYALAVLGVLQLADFASDGAFEKAMAVMRQSNPAPGEVDALLADRGLVTASLIALVLLAALSVPFWHAPALVHWGSQGVGQALFSSTLAVWRCRGAFVVYLLVWFVIVLGVGLASALFFGVLGLRALAQVASFPIMLFVSTLFYASLIFTFNDSFGQQA